MRLKQRRSVRILICAALAALVALAAAVPAQAGRARVVGAVYTETNAVAANSVIKFNRYSDGRLRQVQRVRTGGNGSRQEVGCGPNCPILDSVNAVVATPNGQIVLAVNAGSDTITSFRETSRGLRRVDVESSAGDLPNSIALRGNLVYVLNANSGTISALRLGQGGRLSAIPDSTRSLPTAGPGGAARQIGFDRTGRFLLVTELKPDTGGQIDVFAVGGDGRTTGDPVVNRTASPLPFGFAIHRSGRVLVSELVDPSPAGRGNLSSYTLSAAGQLTPVDTKPTNGPLPCWVSVTRNGRFAFVANTGAPAPSSVARFGVADTGALSPLGNTTGRGAFALTDTLVSRDDRYFYVLAPTVTGASRSNIQQYRIGSNGSLRFIGRTPSRLPTGVTGLAGR